MYNDQSMLNEIIAVLECFGGIARLSDIYNKIEDRGKIDLTEFQDWRVPVRMCIYRHSSDTEEFKGKIGDKLDLFYSVKGKGKGFWGLRKSIEK